MNIELLLLNGYGQFVWPAFLFTFASFLYLYLKIRKELIKQEKIFLKEFKEIRKIEIKTAKKKKRIQKKLGLVAQFSFSK